MYRTILVSPDDEVLPGVHDASFGTVQPLSGNADSDPFAIEGRQLDLTNLTAAGWQVVGAKYLKTLGIPLVRGRDLTPLRNKQTLSKGGVGCHSRQVGCWP